MYRMSFRKEGGMPINEQDGFGDRGRDSDIGRAKKVGVCEIVPR